MVDESKVTNESQQAAPACGGTRLHPLWREFIEALADRCAALDQREANTVDNETSQDRSSKNCANSGDTADGLPSS
jgi:hypothetical protein